MLQVKLRRDLADGFKYDGVLRWLGLVETLSTCHFTFAPSPSSLLLLSTSPAQDAACVWYCVTQTLKTGYNQEKDPTVIRQTEDVRRCDCIGNLRLDYFMIRAILHNNYLHSESTIITLFHSCFPILLWFKDCIFASWKQFNYWFCKSRYMCEHFTPSYYRHFFALWLSVSSSIRSWLNNAKQEDWTFSFIHAPLQNQISS